MLEEKLYSSEVKRSLVRFFMEILFAGAVLSWPYTLMFSKDMVSPPAGSAVLRVKVINCAVLPDEGFVVVVDVGAFRFVTNLNRPLFAMRMVYIP